MHDVPPSPLKYPLSCVRTELIACAIYELCVQFPETCDVNCACDIHVQAHASDVTGNVMTSYVPIAMRHVNCSHDRNCK